MFPSPLLRAVDLLVGLFVSRMVQIHSQKDVELELLVSTNRLEGIMKNVVMEKHQYIHRRINTLLFHRSHTAFNV